MRDLKDKRALVTGAARGIGRAIAERFGSAGAHVIVTDVDEEGVAETVALIREAGGTAIADRLDVTDVESIAAVRSRVLEEIGPIDILVNNAGVVFGGTFGAVPLERHCLTMRVNVDGVVAVTHAFLPDLIGRSSAHIVNVVSASAYVGLPFGSTYAASKWAVMGLGESLRLELNELGHGHVRVTHVCPAYVGTGMFDGVAPPRGTAFLDADDLARRVISAVRNDRTWVRTPWMVRVTPLLRGLLPTPAFDAVGRWLGVNTSMREWRGR